ncbi:tail protein X [Cupriavidus neocaledonicus]|uniref:Phage tail protein n=1 Tax=Cupriavidus neocaledonicus TaxID=1040979 RepID=A0A375H7P9_9BURK|nr:tail protein X [Cupriavidus neocaledonicus]SOZ37705.1 Phage tail protein X [Cupriavidus neocaledonicus]SPD46279.1 Phage tail protein [Cupriavidus neocaledonicus]
MATEYLTRDGDTPDQIAWNYYGTRDGLVVERLLDANPGLADRGPLLPAGVTITLPDLPTPATEQGVRLWD